MHDGKGDFNLVHDIFEHIEKMLNTVCKTRETGEKAKMKGNKLVK